MIAWSVMTAALGSTHTEKAMAAKANPTHELFLRLEEGGQISPRRGINNALMVFHPGQSILDEWKSSH